MLNCSPLIMISINNLKAVSMNEQFTNLPTRKNSNLPTRKNSDIFRYQIMGYCPKGKLIDERVMIRSCKY